ncbi:T9SS type A sorting domain-containing protein [Flavobacterium sp.]|uniref:T9SS type A sorting domain-containing protein n=1 Tax=Flavobacterium sp. TaxID=239 RepID=UPI00260BFC1C|nr:T9SS type A sorting domain-containing protein [Flavobacterium sp.]
MITKRYLLFTLLLTFATFHANAQQVIFGTNNFIEYQVGTLPLVISVPHGGNLNPSSIPNRTCNNPVYATDEFTIETALEIKNKLFELTGCYPHLIISHLNRSKLDPNRNLADGACGNSEAEIAWNEFHGFITNARNTANLQNDYKTFFVDLHGHGNPIQRIELGYLLYDSELGLSDSTLNTKQYLNYSSIKNLVLNNVNNYTHAELLRGPYSLGTFLANNNFPSVPSQSIPFPGTTSNYFSGGYITANHTCYNIGAPINGLQMELNYNNIRNTAANRTAFALAFTQSMISYFSTHFNVSLIGCSTLSTINNELEKKIIIYPNPLVRGDSIHFNFSEDIEYEYQILNTLGQIVVAGQLKHNQSIDSSKLAPGVFLIKLSNKNNNDINVLKIIVQ